MLTSSQCLRDFWGVIKNSKSRLPHLSIVVGTGCVEGALQEQGAGGSPGPEAHPCPSSPPADVGSVEGLAYHRGWDTLYWTSYTTSTITRHTVDQSRLGAFERETVITMSGDDHPRAFVLDECQK